MIKRGFGTCWLLFASASHAVDSGVSPLGFTGALSTPTAATLPQGMAAFGYGNYLDAQGIRSGGHNFLAGIGFLPNVEAFGRLATNTVQTNCFTSDCGIRDLSASLKLSLPEALQPSRQSVWLPSLAAGTTDRGGAATFFRTTYAVGTWDFGQLAFSAGYSQAQADNRAARANLDGAFASLVWQPVRWGQVLTEHDGTRVQGGFRLLADAPLLPVGSRLATEVRTGARADDTAGRDLWFGVSLRLPLGTESASLRPSPQSLLPAALPDPALVSRWRPPAAFPEGAANNTQNGNDASTGRWLVPPSLSQAVTPSQVTATPADTQAPDTDALVARLARAGFQDIRLGRRGETWVVRVENQAYRWNTLDALGIAMGETGRWAGDRALAVEWVVTQRAQPVFRVTTDTRCLNSFMARDNVCALNWLRALPLVNDDNGVAWVTDTARSSLWRPRVELAPELRYGVGTEYGAFDSDLGLATRVEVPLGLPQLVAEGRLLTPLAGSREFRAGGPFAANAIDSGVDRVLLHHYATLPGGFSTHLAGGRVLGDREGGYGELRWASLSGAHAATLLYGQLNRPGETGRPLLGSYRYQLPGSDLQLRAQAGEFLNADRGVQLGLRQSFGDTLVTLFVRQATPEGQGDRQRFAGVEVSLPLTPRQNRPFAWGQLAGNPDQRQFLETRIGSDSNPVFGPATGVFGNPPGSLESSIFNRDRVGSDTLAMHLNRLRDAHALYVAGDGHF